MERKERLLSLDLLRGLDMIFLVLVEPLVLAANQVWWHSEAVRLQLYHTWGTLTAYDVIMPCFIFACGAAIPFSLARRLKDGKPTGDFWGHLAKRFLLLYFLGSVCQCDLLSLDPMSIHVFYNTLQVIAVAYVSTALVMLIPTRAIQIAVPIVLAVGMGLIVHFCGQGNYTETGNFTYVFDRKVWGLFLPEGQRSLLPNGYVTYLLPQLVCSAMAMCGYECARVLKGTRKPWEKAGVLFALSAALLFAGWVVSFKVPVIKHIFSLSFSLYVTGWSVLVLAVLYVIADIWKCRRGWGLVTLFGRNALAAYLLGGVFLWGLKAQAGYLTHGLPRHFGEAVQPFMVELTTVVLLVAAVWIWDGYKKGKGK